jgi:hypothetical protein
MVLGDITNIQRHFFIFAIFKHSISDATCNRNTVFVLSNVENSWMLVMLFLISVSFRSKLFVASWVILNYIKFLKNNLLKPSRIISAAYITSVPLASVYSKNNKTYRLVFCLTPLCWCISKPMLDKTWI